MSMLERAARAVDPWAFDPDNLHLSPAYRQGLARRTARAVLLAIREPDEAMLQPGCTKHKPGAPMSDDRPEECPTFVRRRKVWANMIDAILAGETET